MTYLRICNQCVHPFCLKKKKKKKKKTLHWYQDQKLQYVSDQQQYITEYNIATNVKQQHSMSNLITYTAITFTWTSTWYKHVCRMFIFDFKNSYLPKYPAYSDKFERTSKCVHSPQNTHMPWFEVLTCFPEELLLNYFIIQGLPKKCIHTLTKENSTLYDRLL